MSRVLVIGDLHEPATHTKYFDFVRKVQEKYRTNRTVFIGDIVDHHTISRWPSHYLAENAPREYQSTLDGLLKWQQHFKRATILEGNHDIRIMRAVTLGRVLDTFMRPFEEIYNFPCRWRLESGVEIDDVVYTHGDKAGGGQYPAVNSAKRICKPVVMGHYHKAFGIWWIASTQETTLWGMNVGCGVDADHVAFEYDKYKFARPLLGCGVVIDGHPYLEHMTHG